MYGQEQKTNDDDTHYLSYTALRGSSVVRERM
jgi:hypothetical protein